MPRVAWRWHETEVPVESNGPVVLGVDGERAHADHIRYLKRAPQGVEEQTGTDAAALRVDMDGEARKQKQRDRMAGHALDDALGSLRMLNLAGNYRVEADDLIAAKRNIGLR